MKKITVEKRIIIHDDDVGTSVEVREDADGLDLIEIRAEDSANSAVTLDVAMARALAQALIETADYIETRIANR